MGSSSIDYGWIDDVGCGSNGDFRWTLDGLADLVPTSGTELDGADGEANRLEHKCLRKRSRNEPCAGSKSKACREKKRRERLNDRFLDLSAVLDPGRLPNSDKSSILADATRTLVQLRSEAEELKEANEKLEDTIKDLKEEKNELRDEKLKLKADNERLEQQIKIMSLPPGGYIPHSFAYPAAAAACASHSQASGNKTTPFLAYALPAWQWLPPRQWFPPTARDIAQDQKHVSPTA